MRITINLICILSWSWILIQKIFEKIFAEKFSHVEKNIQNPSSDLIGDYTFKYNEEQTKMRLLNENISEKKNYEKYAVYFFHFKSR